MATTATRRPQLFVLMSAFGPAPEGPEGRQVLDTAQKVCSRWMERGEGILQTEAAEREHERWCVRLESFRALNATTECTNPPKEIALANTRRFLDVLKWAGLSPRQILPSVVGGVGITFRGVTRKVYVEFNNKGNVLALRSDGGENPEVDRVQPDLMGYASLIAGAKAYLDEQDTSVHEDERTVP